MLPPPPLPPSAPPGGGWPPPDAAWPPPPPLPPYGGGRAPTPARAVNDRLIAVVVGIVAVAGIAAIAVAFAVFRVAGPGGSGGPLVSSASGAGSATAPSSAAVVPPLPVAATALDVGDCVNGLEESEDLASLPVLPCSQPHEGEVFAVFDLPPGPYPGAAAVDQQVLEGCDARFAAYDPSFAGGPSFDLFGAYPLEHNWAIGDREVVCIATALDGPTRGSLTQG